jgi:hypothetical protein
VKSSSTFDFDRAVTTAPTVSPESAGLSRKLAEFLVEFATAVQKHAIYPEGHPLLESAIDKLMRRLDPLLAGQLPVAFAVARVQLVIEGVATDPNNPLMRELAGRLHRHQLGAIKILPGVMSSELTDFLAAVAVDPSLQERQIALTAQTERWAHLELLPVSYDRLEIMGESALTPEEASKAGATLMWIALARSALMSDELGDSMVLDPATLARAIASNGSDPAYDQSVLGFLMQITESLKGGGGPEDGGGGELRAQLSELLRVMQPDSLERLMRMGGDADARKRFVLDASHQLAADAVVSLVQAASKASGHEISNSLLRLMGKLALQAEGGGALQRAGATSALRDHVDSLVDGWQAKNLNPGGYQGALDAMSRRQVMSLRSEHRQHPCEPHRMVCTGLETDTLGAAVWRAVDHMVTHGGIATLLDLLDRAPEGGLVSAELWPLVCTRDNVRQLLRDEQVEMRLLERIARRLGLDVVDMLIEALEHAETRTLRRKLLDLLAGFGSEIGPVVVERIVKPDNPWFVQRNLLTLLTMIPQIPEGFSPKAFMGNKDARVRREALKLLLRMPAERDHAITSAVTDSDENIVQVALNAALERCPAGAVPLIVRKVDAQKYPPPTRALAIRVVAAAQLPDTLPWLIAFTVSDKKWYHRGEKFAAKSPELLAAINGLAASWGHDARAAEIVARAGKSKDSEIKAASIVRKRHGDRTDPVS